MKRIGAAVAALLGTASSGVAHTPSPMPPRQNELRTAQLGATAVVQPGDHQTFIRIASVEAEENRFEVTLSGRYFRSRDEAEGYLLYQAALFAQQSGHSWFSLLHLPGESGPEVHPARRHPAFGEAYGHWQPHWSYYQALTGWQPWRPEWAVPFFADQGDARDVERFEVHAMIELGQGGKPNDMQMAFDAASVVKDLKPLASAYTP